jgi:hypothetical protein
MKLGSLGILSFIFMGFYLSTSGVQPAMSQQELCRDAGYVAPSRDMRTVELPQFGIDLNIPENYRTMARKDGSVKIMDPSHFELVSCIARGGKVLDPHGSWGFSIHQVSNPENLTLPDLVAQIEASEHIKLYKYNLDNTNAVIVHDRGRATAYFISPKINKVVAMHVGCDCTVGLEDIVRELNRTRLR